MRGYHAFSPDRGIIPSDETTPSAPRSWQYGLGTLRQCRRYGAENSESRDTRGGGEAAQGESEEEERTGRAERLRLNNALSNSGIHCVSVIVCRDGKL